MCILLKVVSRDSQYKIFIFLSIIQRKFRYKDFLSRYINRFRASTRVKEKELRRYTRSVYFPPISVTKSLCPLAVFPTRVSSKLIASVAAFY